VIAILAEATPDALAADALMRASRDDLAWRSLAWRSLADLLAAGQVDTVVRLALASTDQS
jgi:hypothetical protein